MALAKEVTLTLSIGAQIKILRHNKNMTQEVLAYDAGVDVRVVQRLEQDKNIPSAENLAAITDTLGTTVNALFNGAGAVASSKSIPVETIANTVQNVIDTLTAAGIDLKNYIRL